MRHKDENWNMPAGEPNTNGSGRVHSWDSIKVSLLMDIRDELKSLNAVLHCTNFLSIPQKLDAISANTRKPKKSKLNHAR